MKILYIFILMFWGCSVDPQKKAVDVYVENKFSFEQKDEIVSAVLNWNKAFNGQVSLEVVDLFFNHEKEKYDRAYVYDSIIIYMNSEKELTNILGIATKKYGAGFISLNVDVVSYYNCSLRNVVLHELGHVFGAKHANHGLMFPEYSGENYSCIDKSTTEQVEKAMGLDQNSMLYCETK